MTTVADEVRPFITGLLDAGDDLERLRVGLEFWDGSRLGPADDEGIGTLAINSPDAVRRIVWSPGELGVARAFVAGEIEARGDIFELIAALRDVTPSHIGLGPRDIAQIAGAARRLQLLSRPPEPPPEEARPAGWRQHSLRRDAQVVSHHYDVGNDFYRLVLGESMTYSCARFVDDAAPFSAAALVDAQAAKHDLICRKLGLAEQPGATLLDVGCGWGSMAIHAAANYGATVLGVTISEQQAQLARERVKAAGVDDLVTIELRDYRELGGRTFDAISSIGMFEHVGRVNAPTYFATLYAALRPQGRLLNHAITSVGGSKIPRRSFIGRYVFPDGELLDVGDAIVLAEQAGFEIRDVESLREHYAVTLRHWVRNLQQQWDDAVAMVGERRARVWLLYMAASAVGFEDGGIGLHQVLCVRTASDGTSGVPRTRSGWV